MDTGDATATTETMSVMQILEQIARALPDALIGRSGHIKEQQLNQESVERAREIVDRWNERTRENWRRDGAG